MSTPAAFISKHKAWLKAAVALLNAFLLLATGYLADRAKVPVGGEEAIMKKIEALRLLLGLGNNMPETDFLPVDVGYDREFVTAYDSFGIPVGTRPVISRRKLLSLLDSLNGCRYKALVLDIRFYESDSTAVDSLLFRRINSMPRILLAGNDDEDAVKAISPSLYAYAGYGTTLEEGNFVKYRFSHDEMPSIASRVRAIEGGGEADGAMFLPLPYRLGEGYDTAFNKTLYHLGTDILDVYNREEISQMAEGRVVFVGDYSETDRHDSYVGEISGPEIHLNAILALREGKDRFNLWVAAAMLVIYFFLSLSAMSDFSKSLPSWVGRYKVSAFILSLISWSTILVAAFIAIYLITGVFHDIYFVTLYLTAFHFAYPKAVAYLKKRFLKVNQIKNS